MWSVDPIGWCASRYNVEDGGRPIGVLDLGGWRRGRGILIGTQHLGIEREGWWRPEYRLAGAQITARPAGAWRGGFLIEHEGQEYVLQRSSVWGRSFELKRGGTLLGEVRSVGLFSSRAQADIKDEVPLELRLFVVWLVLLAWRNAAAAGAAAGVVVASS